MSQFRLEDIHAIERVPTSPSSLRSKVGGMILCSTDCRAKVESINQQTGEYRIVLQGTLDKEQYMWDKD